MAWTDQQISIPKFNFTPNAAEVSSGMGRLDNPNGYNASFQNYGNSFLNNGTGNTNPWDNGFFGSSAFGNALQGIGLGMNLFNGFNSYRQGKEYLNLARDNLNFQQNLTNESYNNVLKQWNARQADVLRQRAAFETGNSNAYNDEIAANAMQRGQTGQAGSDYLNYQRSANAA